MSSERTLEDYFYKRNILHLQSDGKISLIHGGGPFIKFAGHGCFGPCQLGRWWGGRGKESNWSSGVGIVLSFPEDL